MQEGALILRRSDGVKTLTKDDCCPCIVVSASLGVEVSFPNENKGVEDADAVGSFVVSILPAQDQANCSVDLGIVVDGAKKARPSELGESQNQAYQVEQVQRMQRKKSSAHWNPPPPASSSFSEVSPPRPASFRKVSIRSRSMWPDDEGEQHHQVL